MSDHVKTVKSKRRIVVGGLAIMLLASAGAQAAENVYAKPDGSWVSLNGTVVSHTPKSFTLDYGEGTILVETDDWDRGADGWAILEGDQVTVYGKVDDDLFEKTKIEAESVYVEDMNTLLTAPSSADEETIPTTITYFAIPTDVDLQVTGTVSSVKGREFKIDTGAREMTIDTLSMGYNPLDQHGLQKIEKGDLVTVTGNLDKDFFGGRELEAENIISFN